MRFSLSENYFSLKINNLNANPILWTTHLMTPETYPAPFSLIFEKTRAGLKMKP